MIVVGKYKLWAFFFRRRAALRNSHFVLMSFHNKFPLPSISSSLPRKKATFHSFFFPPWENPLFVLARLRPRTVKVGSEWNRSLGWGNTQLMRKETSTTPTGRATFSHFFPAVHLVVLPRFIIFREKGNARFREGAFLTFQREAQEQLE